MHLYSHSISHTIQTLQVTQQQIHTLHEQLGKKGGYYAPTIQIIISPYTHLHTKHYSLAYVFNNHAKLKFVWTQRCPKNLYVNTAVTLKGGQFKVSGNCMTMSRYWSVDIMTMQSLTLVTFTASKEIAVLRYF